LPSTNKPFPSDEVGDRTGEAATLNNIGSAHNNLGDENQALAHYRQALTIQREVDDRTGEATTLNNISAIQFQRGDFAGTEKTMEEVLGILHAAGDRGSEAMASFNMAILLKQMTRVDEAVDYQRRAIDLAEQTSHPSLEMMRAFLIELEQTKG
jgi:tetratricopeptide (TPR) repeat protein